MAPAMLSAATQRAVDAAVDDATATTCARCGTSDHTLLSCPANDSVSKKGTVWKEFNPGAAQGADEYLKKHARYKYVAPPPVQKKLAEGGGRGRKQQYGGGGKGKDQQYSGGEGFKPSKAETTSTKPPPVKSAEHIRGPDYSNSIAGCEMYYPKEERALSEEKQKPTNTGKEWNPPKELLDRTKTLKIQNPEFALRQNFFFNPAGQRVLTNHFEYSVEKDTTFYEYKILDLDTKNRKKLRALVNIAIDEWSFLRVDQTYFATNYIDTIVSWKPLHLKLDEGENLKNDGIAEWSRSITVGGMKQALRFRFVKEIPIYNLERYASADPSYETTNFDNIAKCLNLVISKSFTAEVHKLSANKFFVKKARVPLVSKNKVVSDSPEIIRGYFYNVKPGMGNIVLNFNISTSAVFRPINVADFLNDNRTFDKDKLANILVGRNVYVDHTRNDLDPEKMKHLNSEDSRYWRVCELQRGGNIEDLSFWKKTMDSNSKLIMKKDKPYEVEATETSVFNHLTNGKFSFQ
jgi:hypothetical protein